MSHLSKDKSKLVQRIRRIRGQVEAVKRALEADKDCGDVLQMIAAARGAMNSLTAELLEEHIRFHVVDAGRSSKRQRNAAEELIEIVQSYFK
ncbi:MAG TPA: metal/formaldehyde-sensitive transcriptional repressor [Acidobacteriota bacterium]|nr:metal/formaldehyde-sensitive transcriptional repressor [Acidobacteriota bacterium]